MWQRHMWLGLWGCVWVWMLACSPSGGDLAVGNSGGSPGGSAAGGSGGGGGRPGGFSLSLGQARDSGNTEIDDCADSAKVIYLVTQENYLYSFDPRIVGLQANRHAKL
jgi:hypothetical protein